MMVLGLNLFIYGVFMIFTSFLRSSLIFMNMQIRYIYIYIYLTIGRKLCVLASIWYQGVCSRNSSTLDTIDFVDIPPVLRII